LLNGCSPSASGIGCVEGCGQENCYFDADLNPFFVLEGCAYCGRCGTLCADYCTGLQGIEDMLCTGPHSERATSLAAKWPGAVCTDDCVSAANGVCEDGEPDADGTGCEYGMDCWDCGARFPGKLCLFTGECVYYVDGKCDDGGPGAATSLCPLGTDCYDCGPRDLPGDAGSAGAGGANGAGE